MPDEPNQLDDAWSTDSIESVSRGPEASFRHEDTRLRPDRKSQFLRLGLVTVYVRDLERSSRFYLEQLGFILIADVRFSSGNRWIHVAPPDGTASLALVVPRQGYNEEHFIGQPGQVSFITEDVEAKYREWSDRGVKFTIPPQTPAWGGTFCRFEDLDGNAFVLVGFDEITREVESRRRSLALQQEAERRAAQELEIAKQVQARLFPQRLPVVPGLDYAGLCIQARSVGGDYYDFLELGADRTALVIGDIAGKGIAGALLMANLQANLRSQCINAVEQPEQYLGSVNRMLFENTTANAYATLFFAEYDHATGRLRYANCGHLAALVLRESGVIESLDATCTVVGLFEDWQCSVADCLLEPGDVLALFTDGVTESPNSENEEFGEERLKDALRRHRALPAQEMAAAVVDEVVRFSASEQFDDITLIIAKRTAD